MQRRVLHDLPSILYMECRAVFGLALAPVVEAGGGFICMSHPPLYLGDVGFVRQRIGCGPPAHGMYAHADCFSADNRRLGILDDDIPVDGTGIEMPVERASAVVCDGAEERIVQPQTILPPAVVPGIARYSSIS